MIYLIAHQDSKKRPQSHTDEPVAKHARIDGPTSAPEPAGPEELPPAEANCLAVLGHVLPANCLTVSRV